MDVDAPYDEDEEDVPPVEVKKEELVKTSRGRLVPKKSYIESAESSNAEDDEIDLIDQKDDPPRVDDDEDDVQPKRRSTRAKKANLVGGLLSDEDAEPLGSQGRQYSTRSKNKPAQPTTNGTSRGERLSRRKNRKAQSQAATRQSARRLRSNAKDELDDTYVDEPENSASGDESADDIAETSELENGANDPEPGAEADGEGEPDDKSGKAYSLRQRSKVNYAIPPPIEEMAAPPPKPRSKGKNGRGFGGSRPKAPGWSATGAQLDRWLGGAGDDSVSRQYVLLFQN